MNKDDAREAAVNETARLMVRDSTRGSRKQILEALYDAGAASVDRRAIVQEAFEKVRDWTLFKSTDATRAGTQLVGEAMDVVIAEMGGGIK